MRAIPLRFEQEKVLKSMIPIFPKQDIEERIGIPIPSPTLAAMYPYVFDSIKDPGLSTLLGVDFSGGVILFNQFLYQIQKEHNRNNANMIILGTSGSGKSTAAKLLLRNHIRNGYKMVLIDPEGELEDMTRLYGGDFIDLGKGGEFGMINPLEVIMDADEEEIKQGMGYAVLTRSLQTVKAFMKYYDPSNSRALRIFLVKWYKKLISVLVLTLMLTLHIIPLKIILLLKMYMQQLEERLQQCLSKVKKEIFWNN